MDFKSFWRSFVAVAIRVITGHRFPGFPPLPCHYSGASLAAKQVLKNPGRLGVVGLFPGGPFAGCRAHGLVYLAGNLYAPAPCARFYSRREGIVGHDDRLSVGVLYAPGALFRKHASAS